MSENANQNLDRRSRRRARANEEMNRRLYADEVLPDFSDDEGEWLNREWERRPLPPPEQDSDSSLTSVSSIDSEEEEAARRVQAQLSQRVNLEAICNGFSTYNANIADLYDLHLDSPPPPPQPVIELDHGYDSSDDEQDELVVPNADLDLPNNEDFVIDESSREEEANPSNANLDLVDPSANPGNANMDMVVASPLANPNNGNSALVEVNPSVNPNNDYLDLAVVNPLADSSNGNLSLVEVNPLANPNNDYLDSLANLNNDYLDLAMVNPLANSNNGNLFLMEFNPLINPNHDYLDLAVVNLSANQDNASLDLAENEPLDNESMNDSLTLDEIDASENEKNKDNSTSNLANQDEEIEGTSDINSNIIGFKLDDQVKESENFGMDLDNESDELIQIQDEPKPKKATNKREHDFTTFPAVKKQKVADFEPEPNSDSSDTN